MAAELTSDRFVPELVTVLCRIEHIELWKLRPSDENEDTATLLVGANPARVRGTLDGHGYEVRNSDVPVREGFAALFEVSR